jgi:AcrR family transcriptional regulator
LRAERSHAGSTRILDAAGELFAERGVNAVSMGEIAKAAGCSRATLYRYFADRHELQRAFVHREARRVGNLVAEEVAAIEDPRDRLATAIAASVRRVRETSTLLAWFADSDAATTAELAASDDVIEALGRSLTGDSDAARWLVRVIVSLLTVPGRNDSEERRLVERFVIPSLMNEWDA